MPSNKKAASTRKAPPKAGKSSRASKTTAKENARKDTSAIGARKASGKTSARKGKASVNAASAPPVRGVAKSSGKSAAKTALAKSSVKKSATDVTVKSAAHPNKGSADSTLQAAASGPTTRKNAAAKAASSEKPVTGKPSTKAKAPERAAARASRKTETVLTAKAVAPTAVAHSPKASTPVASPTKELIKASRPVAKAASPSPEAANRKPVQTTAKLKNEKSSLPVTQPKIKANSAVSSPSDSVEIANAPREAAQVRATASKTPAASEPIQVAKKTPEKAASPATPAVAPSTIQPSEAIHTPDAAKSAAPASKPVTTPVVPPKAKPANQKHGFKMNEFIVYPAHGVGQITGVELQEVAGFSLELFVVSFIKDKMILKVPTSKVAAVGMRKLAEVEIVDKALGTLSGRARVKRTMWSRRAQEYEAKINSGDLVVIAEVVRDLYRSDTQPEQSYSERQLYEAALDRMAREIAVVRKLIDAEALKLIEAFLLKGPKRGQKTDADVADDEADVDRAA